MTDGIDPAMPSDTPLISLLRGLEAAGYTAQFVARDGGVLWYGANQHENSPRRPRWSSGADASKACQIRPGACSW